MSCPLFYNYVVISYYSEQLTWSSVELDLELLLFSSAVVVSTHFQIIKFSSRTEQTNIAISNFFPFFFGGAAKWQWNEWLDCKLLGRKSFKGKACWQLLLLLFHVNFRCWKGFSFCFLKEKWLKKVIGVCPFSHTRTQTITIIINRNPLQILLSPSWATFLWPFWCPVGNWKVTRQT